MSINSNTRTLSFDSAEGSVSSKNYLKSSFETGNTSGWSLFNTTLTAGQPTGAISAGATSLTMALTQTNPLSGSASLQLVGAAAVTAGHGLISDVFTIERTDQAKLLAARYAYEVVSGTANINASGILGSQTIGVYFYDVANSAWIQPIGFLGLNQTSGPALHSQISFQTPAIGFGSQFRMALVFLQASAGAVTLNLDNLALGPQSVTTGAVMTDWISYTPVWTNFGAGTTNVGKWRRVGDTMEIQLSASGAASSGAVAVSAPSGFTIDTSKIPAAASVIGEANYYSGTGSAVYAGIVEYASTTTFSFYGPSAGIWNATSPTTAGACNSLAANIRVPIVGWSSNVQLSSDSSAAVVSFYGCAPGQAYTSIAADISFTASKDTTGSWNGTAFKVPVSGDYATMFTVIASPASFFPVIYLNGATYQYGTLQTSASNASSGAVFMPGLKAGDLISMRVGTSGNILTPTTMGIFRLSGNNAVAQVESVAATYGLLASQTIASGGGIIKFDTRLKDSSGGMYNPATGIITITIVGSYTFNVAFQSTSGTAGITLTKNGTALAYVANVAASNLLYTGGITIPLLAGDQITFVTNGTGITLLGNNPYVNYFSMVRTGNY